MSPDNQITPGDLASWRPTRRGFLRGVVAAAGLIAGFLAYDDHLSAAPETQTTPIPTGILPFVEGAPQPFEIIENPDGYEFSRVVKSVNIREEQNGDAQKVQPNPLQTGETLQVIPPVVDTSGRLEEVGGVNIPDNKGGSNTWTRALKVDNPNISGFVAEGTLEDPYILPVTFNELTPEEQALYILKQEVLLPGVEESIDLTQVFEKNSAVGGVKDNDTTIVALWGHELTSTRIKQGSKFVFSEPKTPTRDELNVPVHAWERVVGLAAISASEPTLPDDQPRDADGIIELMGAGGMKAVSITVDAQEVQSDSETSPAPSVYDIVTRVGNFFVVSRVAMRAAQGTIKAINEVQSVGLTDWKGFAAYIGDTAKAARIASKLTNVGGSNSQQTQKLLGQIGGLKQAATFIFIEGGGFAPKIDAVMATEFFGSGLTDRNMQVTYAMSEDGTPMATVNNGTTEVGNLIAVQNTAGEWVWEKVGSEQDKIINTLSQIEGYEIDSSNIEDLGDGVWHSELRANNGLESFDVLSSLGTHGSFSFLIPSNLGTTLKNLYFLTDDEVKTLNNLPDNWQINSNLMRGLAEFIPALVGNLLENPNIFGDKLYEASLTPTLKAQYHVVFGLLPLSESSDTQERTLTEYNVGGGTEVTTYDYRVKRDSSGNALVISTGNLTNSPTVNAVGELAIRKLGDDLYTSLRDHNFIGTPKELFGLIARHGAWNSLTGLLTGTGYNDRAPRDDQLLGPENPYEKRMAIGTKVDELLGDTSMWAIASEEHCAFILDLLTKALGGYTLTEEDLSAIREGNPDFSSTFVSLN